MDKKQNKCSDGSVRVFLHFLTRFLLYQCVWSEYKIIIKINISVTFHPFSQTNRAADRPTNQQMDRPECHREVKLPTSTPIGVIEV